MGPTPSKPVENYNYFKEFISKTHNSLANKIDADCYEQLLESYNEPRVVYSRGYDTSNEHLSNYLKDNTTESEFPVENILNILEFSKFKWFGSPKVTYYDGSEIFHLLRTNPEAYSGHYTSKIFGQEKKYSEIASKDIAYKLWQVMKEKPIKNFYLWSVLGREKDIKVNSGDFKDAGTRIILTTENPATTLLMWFAQKITHVLMNDSTWDCTYNISGEFNAIKYKKLLDREKDYDFILEADWRYYDSNQDTNFLLVAAQVLLSALPNDRLHKNIKYYITSSIITKYIALPPGVVIELNRAQPSGHPFGTLINCNVNLIYWCIIGYKIYGEDYVDNMHVEVYGDDTRAYFKKHKNLSNIDRYIKEAGLQSDPVVNNFRSINERCDKKHEIDYLKRRFDVGGMYWNHKKMFDRFLYQSKSRSINEQVRLVTSYFESVPSDENCYILAKTFCNYIKNKYNNRLDEDTKELVYQFGGFASAIKGRSECYRYGFNINRNLSAFITEMGIYSYSSLYYKEELPRPLIYIASPKYNLALLTFAFPNVREYYESTELLGRSPPVRLVVTKEMVKEFWQRVDSKIYYRLGKAFIGHRIVNTLVRV